jgi:hypothetical protein
LHPNAILLGSQLGGRSHPPYNRRLILNLCGLLNLAAEKGSAEDNGRATDENHFHLV